jgi:predicted transcriptional regulator
METMMTTIKLEPDISEQITYLAEESQVSADAFVDKALRGYLAQFRREKIRSEMEAFNQQRAKLLTQFSGKYVAVHNGQVIDHDKDLRTLHLRIFALLGRMPVLLKQVTQEPERELVFRSPRFERGK